MSSDLKDYYGVLGVSRTASNAEIKQAYHRLARRFHPDLHLAKDRDRHSKRMQEVNEAYAVLSSKENRAKYDQFGKHWKEGPPPSRQDQPGARGSPGSTEEAFSEFFQNMFRQQGASGEPDQRILSELDIEATLGLSLEEAVHGVEKAFSLQTAGLCQRCHGTGRQGKIFCPACGGIGEVRRQREVKTRIPSGLHSHSRIRLKGQGNEGPQGTGDLYLNIRLLPDPKFKVDGKNLETDVRVTPWAAWLGSSVAVETLDGPVRIHIPKATHSGTRLRLGGKGLGKSGERGDLFVRIEIDIPDSLTPKAEALLKELQEETRG